MMVVFGGSGGIGVQLRPFFPSAYFVSSKDIDLTDTESLENFFTAIRPSIVLNLAGFHTDGFLHKQSQEDLDRIIAVNVTGTVNLLRYALPNMREKKKGRIILASSFLARENVLGTAVYSASKSFIDQIVRNCAAENGRFGVTCNAIRLGYFDGGMTHRIRDWKALQETIPAGRFGSADDLSKTIKYIVDSPYLNGATIDLTGGL